MSRKPTDADILMWDQLLPLQLKMYALLSEYKFHPSRKWRFDFALMGMLENKGKNIAIEIEGGIWNHGAHVRGKHFESDMSKYNEATSLGWKVFRFSTKQVLDGTAIAFIRRVLEES